MPIPEIGFDPFQPVLPGLELSEFATPSHSPSVDPSILAVRIREAYARRQVQASTQTPEISDDVFDTPRFENMVSGGGFTVHLAKLALAGASAEQSIKDVAARVTAAKIRKATKTGHKPRGTSYPQDESRAEGFNSYPTTEELRALEQPVPGETYTGKGREVAKRTAAILAHHTVRKETHGLPENQRIAIERARSERHTNAS
jgi:hypothetical protein